MKQSKEQKNALVPPDGWANPAGGDVSDVRGDRLSWELAVRRGLADKAKSQVEQLAPLVERTKHMLKIGRARALNFPMEENVAVERARSLEALEPQLEMWQARLKACAPWLGCAGKSLDRALAAADAAVVQAEQPVAELDEARRVIGRLATVAGLDPKEIDPAFSGVDKVFRSRLKAAREAAAAARQERDENQTEIARLEKELASLNRRVA